METTEKKQYELQALADVWNPEQLTSERVSASRMVDDDVLETLKDVLEEHFIDLDGVDWNFMLNNAIRMVVFPVRNELEEELKQKAKDVFAEKGLEFNGNLRIEWDILDWDPFGFWDDEENILLKNENELTEDILGPAFNFPEKTFLKEMEKREKELKNTKKDK